MDLVIGFRLINYSIVFLYRENKLWCTLWGAYADDVVKFIENNVGVPVVIMI